jgi:transposase-like protein
LGEGQSVAEVAKALEVSGATYLHWRNQFGAMKAEHAKELRRLKDENQQLKRDQRPQPALPAPGRAPPRGRPAPNRPTITEGAAA